MPADPMMKSRGRSSGCSRGSDRIWGPKPPFTAWDCATRAASVRRFGELHLKIWAASAVVQSRATQGSTGAQPTTRLRDRQDCGTAGPKPGSIPSTLISALSRPMPLPTSLRTKCVQMGEVVHTMI